MHFYTSVPLHMEFPYTQMCLFLTSVAAKSSSSIKFMFKGDFLEIVMGFSHWYHVEV